MVDLENDGSGLGFGIVGGRSTGVAVKTILAGSPADKVKLTSSTFLTRFILVLCKSNQMICLFSRMDGFELAIICCR